MVASLIVSDDDPSTIAQRGLAWRKWIGRCEAVGRNEKASVEPDTSAVEADITAPSGASLYVTKALIERIGLMYDPYFSTSRTWNGVIGRKGLGSSATRISRS
jgi:N-acetylglucosaminyl-diphospho-decaprenol L-rhamnosyltransferase